MWVGVGVESLAVSVKDPTLTELLELSQATTTITTTKTKELLIAFI